MAKYTQEEANELLPSAPTRSIPDPANLCYLVIGPPKFGKTSWACGIPDALLVAFEAGHSFQEAHKVVIDKWAGQHDIYEDDEGVRHMTMTQLKDILLSSNRFKTVIIDTADMAAKSCGDYICKQKGWAHPKEGGDFGVGYDIAVTSPFRQMIGEIMRSGRGVIFITHSQEKESKLKSATAKKETTLPGGVHKFVHTQADVILHGSFGKHLKGSKARDRIFQTAPDEETLAGTRAKGINLPPRFIVDEQEPWAQWCSFFTDPEAGDLATLQYQGHKVEKDVEETADETAAAEPAPTTAIPTAEETEEEEVKQTAVAKKKPRK